ASNESRVWNTSAGWGGMLGLSVVNVYVSRSRRYRKPASASIRSEPGAGSRMVALSSVPRRLLLNSSLARPENNVSDDRLVRLSPGIVASMKGTPRSVEPRWPDDPTVRLVERVGT